MKFAIHAPSSFEADVEVDKDREGFTVTPEGFVGHPSATCAYVVQYDDNDKILARYKLVFDSGKDGKLRLLPSRNTEKGTTEVTPGDTPVLNTNDKK